MKKIYLITLLCLLGLLQENPLSGQQYWMRSLPNLSGLTECYPTADGGYVTLGISQGLGSRDVAVYKHASNGGISWTRLFGNGSTDEFPRSLAIMPDGGYIVAGQTSGSGTCIFARLDAAGATLWTTSEEDAMNSVAEVIPLPGGDIIVVGNLGSDGAFMRLNSQGNVVWSKRMYGGFAVDPQIRGGILLNNGNVLAFGAVRISSATSYAALIEVSTNGNLVAANTFGFGPAAEVIQTDDGNLVLLMEDGFGTIYKFTPGYNLLWGKKIDHLDTQPGGVAELPNGDLIVSIQNNAGSSVQHFAGILKLDATGNILQQRRAPELSTTFVNQLSLNTNDLGVVYAGSDRVMKIHPDLDENCSLTPLNVNFTVTPRSESFTFYNLVVANTSPSTGNYFTLTSPFTIPCSYRCVDTICSLEASAAVMANESCAGNADGSASVSAVNGANYSYDWGVSAGNQTGVTATGLSPGTYTVTVTDQYSCQDTAMITIAQGTAIQLSSSAVGATCDEANGSATVVASGGSGNYSFQWDVSTGSQQTATATNLAGGIYTVTVTDSNGCSSSNSVMVGNTNTPNADAGTNQEICVGETASLVGSGGVNYSWNQGLGTGATQNVAPLTTTLYELVVDNANGCSDTAQVLVTVNPLPNAAINGTTSICEGDSTFLIASGGSNIVWSNGPTVSSQWVSPNTTTDYTVTVTDANNCVATATETVTINPNPTANAGPDQTLCEGSTATLTASGGTSYTWNQGLGSGAVQTVSPSVTTIYEVQVTDGNGCTASDQVTLNVNPSPQVLSSPDETICAGTNTSISANGALAYTWDQGLGVGAVQSIAPTTTTTYMVTGTNAAGCSATDAVTITVNALPNAAIGGNASICNGDSTFLTASGGAGYTWSNGATTSSQWVSPSAATIYTVTVTDANGCVNTTTETITVNPNPVAVAGPDLTICQGDAATLNASGGSMYTWNQGLGAGASQTASPSVTTTYQVVVTDANGCSDIDQVIVNVNPTPQITTNPNQTICAGTSTTLTASGGAAYTWDQGLGAGAMQTVSPATNTTYTVTGTDANGCSANSAVTITVNALPNAAISGLAAICEGDSSLLTASGGISYAWSNGPTAASQWVAPTSSTVYSVTVTDGNGCLNTATETVTVNPNPIANAGPDQVICQGGSASLNASGGTNYFWNQGLGNGASQSVNPFVTTSYEVMVTDGNGCTATDLVVVTVNPNPQVTTSPDLDICEGGNATINASGAVFYNWDQGLGSGASQTVTPLQTTTYTVIGTDSTNCSDTNMVTIMVNPLPVAIITGDTLLCEGESTTLTGGGGLQYAWSTGDNTVSILLTPTATSVYTVTATDQNGCEGMASTQVQVDPLPAVPTISQLGSDLISTTGFSYQWTIGGVPIPNATNQSYAPIQSGMYAVVVTNAAGCTSTSVPLNFTYVSLDVVIQETRLKLHPNPTRHEVRIELENPPLGRRTIQVYDLRGKPVLSEQTGEWEGRNTHDMTLSELSAGIYWVRVFTTNAVYTEKLVITR